MCMDHDGTVVLMEWVVTFFILFCCQYTILYSYFGVCLQEILGDKSYLMWFLYIVMVSPDTLDQVEVSKDLFGKNSLYLQGE